MQGRVNSGILNPFFHFYLRFQSVAALLCGPFEDKLLLEIFLRHPEANPTIAGYNASEVKIYFAASRLARSENKKNIFSTMKKRYM
jgi:hypothetical protein